HNHRPPPPAVTTSITDNHNHHPPPSRSSLALSSIFHAGHPLSRDISRYTSHHLYQRPPPSSSSISDGYKSDYDQCLRRRPRPPIFGFAIASRGA
ncbi:hypothetical protein A2U01_0069978, partial [Trifolium medium]|nr:hypothetical protein [Trifolium medium]